MMFFLLRPLSSFKYLSNCWLMYFMICPRVWYRYPPGKDHVTEHHRGLVQALLLNESILVQRNSLDDLASPFTKTDMRKKPCLMLMLLSHVRKPPFLPNRLSLCSVRLTSRVKTSTITITYAITMAYEDFRIWKQIHSDFINLKS